MGSKRPIEFPEQVQRENGLRTLAARAGRHLPVAQIQHAIEKPSEAEGRAGLRELVSGTESMADSNAKRKAETFWRLIQSEIAEIGPRDHSKRRAALHAAFLLGEERQASLGRRLERAREAGKFGDATTVGRDRPRQYWTDGVIDLALALDKRIAELVADPSGWSRYEEGATATANPESALAPSAMLPVPVDAQPVFVEQHIATYVMRGRSVNYAVSERRVRAMEHGVAGYVVRTYEPATGRHPVRVLPVLNCRGGPVRSVPDGRGGEIHERSMFFPVPLLYGETTFFASQVIHDEGDEAHMAEIQVTSHGIAAGGLTMRVQFEKDVVPVASWWFADVIDARRLDKPPAASERRLRPTRCGYLEHTFPNQCRPLAKYGLAWEW